MSMDGLRLYVRYAAASVRGQMQYPASFLMASVGQFAATVIEMVGVWVLFSRFGQIKGWGFGEVAVFYGVVNAAFALADAPTRGFDIFGPQFVKTGDFDRLLLRPRATALQLLGYELRLTRVGRLAQGLLVLAIGAHMTHLAWTPRAVLLLVAALSSGMALFAGLLVLQATLAFWTVESLEVANVLTYGGVEAAQYPLNVYADWLRNFLTYVVPIGCVAYYPVVGLLGRHDPMGAPDWFLAASPVFGFIFLGAALWIWGFGVRRYTSTGS
jgi:ABC-2 type transport system permease protein